MPVGLGQMVISGRPAWALATEFKLADGEAERELAGAVSGDLFVRR